MSYIGRILIEDDMDLAGKKNIKLSWENKEEYIGNRLVRYMKKKKKRMRIG